MGAVSQFYHMSFPNSGAKEPTAGFENTGLLLPFDQISDSPYFLSSFFAHVTLMQVSGASFPQSLPHSAARTRTSWGGMDTLTLPILYS
jgi:hypothetical protein